MAANPGLCDPISKFIESDLIPIFLLSDANSVRATCLMLSDFFIDVSLSLEMIEPKSFPQKSLSFAETFNRGINALRANYRTSDQHVNFFFVFAHIKYCVF